MKKNDITLTPDMLRTKKNLNLTGRILAARWLRTLAAWYSAALGEKVTARQALHLTNAQCAAAMLLLPVAASLCYYILVLCWFALALHGCRRCF